MVRIAASMYKRCGRDVKPTKNCCGKGWHEVLREEDVKTALQSVNDPEIPVSVWDLGLVTNFGIEGHRVSVQLTFTALGCSCMDWILDDVKAAVLRVPEVSAVEVEVVWDPPWTTDRMTAKARQQLAAWGIQS
ncbi:MAG: benzoyl-CoA oxygenase [Sulfobacillus acidophilus]|uniref:Benzoyl-CoA oxygenase n=1 Tax=Sulfobacillus acidophilus TaxID=53633 RepID=A0A2T2WHF5_9FIRM|nr:MAG: benzoyl-CoA oxygenase [Sulfobacillus acidophilus]